ncbi:short-chain dehydrogenase [Microbacterium aurum]|uniref:Short-chain dehydrogenase n=1 Tax=Microbacterium aurum TaxID=36805 RepID=A0A1P8U8N0_9MICO|nr:SDR family NAD(P)-dependent oxidoreductase [Microbacterium aurum]APZ34461.1 short-chain dehydrogenase [Microbacterium aurum]MBM7828333.1 3-oxoacyl-[acyl-carrier protein] reductase [Microbacterium aurum]
MTTSPARLTGITAIVTGGIGGIGAAIVRRLVDEGAEAVVLDLPVDGAQERAADLGARFLPLDLADPDQTRAAIADATAALGGVDVLVNCAGVFRLVPLLEIDAAEWDRVMDINARGTLTAMQAVAPAMMARGGGRIVNLASMAAKSGGAMEAHYAASKSAVVALTRAAAIEWGPFGITVNAICPGYVLTDMGAATRSEEQVAQWTARSPLGRLGQPDDVAGLVAYLATDGAYVTGQALNVTGGMVMH